MNETLEGAWKGSEYPVKPIDEKNDAPVFTDDGTVTGTTVSSYRAERAEDTDAGSTPSLTITEAFRATDNMVGEDDDSGATPAGPGVDILTYTLTGADAKYFEITGTVDNPGATSPDDDGVLTIKSRHEAELRGQAGVPVKDNRHRPLRRP